MGKGFINGLLVRSMMVNGRMAVSKDMESGKAKTAIPILESGKILKLTVTEFTPGPQVINMKVIVIRGISKIYL